MDKILLPQARIRLLLAIIREKLMKEGKWLKRIDKAISSWAKSSQEISMPLTPVPKLHSTKDYFKTFKKTKIRKMTSSRPILLWDPSWRIIRLHRKIVTVIWSIKVESNKVSKINRIGLWSKRCNSFRMETIHLSLPVLLKRITSSMIWGCKLRIIKNQN